MRASPIGGCGTRWVSTQPVPAASIARDPLTRAAPAKAGTDPSTTWPRDEVAPFQDLGATSSRGSVATCVSSAVSASAVTFQAIDSSIALSA